MVQQLFEALFAISLIGLASAPVVGLLLLVLPRKKGGRRIVGTSKAHVHV